MDWRPDQGRSDHAKRVVREVLERDEAPDALARYYAWESDYAGATFLELRPNDAFHIGPVDLLAASILSVRVAPMAVRRFTEPDTSRRLTTLLKQLEITRRLEDDDTYVRAPVMAELHDLVKQCLWPAHATKGNAWVTASKICARKRPALFPVRDNRVVRLLGLTGTYPEDWPVYADVLRDPALMTMLDDIVKTGLADQADKHPERLSTSLRLRNLDILLWMHSGRRTT